MITLKPITIVDARMGRGKSSAAIKYMNDNKDSKRFLYVTPFLNEVDRICEQCDFNQPDGDASSKSAELKTHLRNGKNVATSHALFYLMDNEALDIIRDKGYSLIIDESLRVIERLNITKRDFDLVTEQLTVEDRGALHWKDSDYSGRFSDYKEMADANTLCRLDNALIRIMNPELLRAFDEVYMLTYLFDGQYQKAYLDFFGFEYKVVGIKQVGKQYVFSDALDDPPPLDYRGLIRIIDNKRMNAPGEEKHALSVAWFSKRGYDDSDICTLRSSLKNFFRRITASEANTRLWTTFKEDRDKLVDERGRHRKDFLQINSRATNEYRNKTDIAYIANRFVDPNLAKFFSQRGIRLDVDDFALGEMLQWIWRSAIRDDKPINLYIPSKRMRTLLTNWIDKTSKEGGAANAQ